MSVRDNQALIKETHFSLKTKKGNYQLSFGSHCSGANKYDSL